MYANTARRIAVILAVVALGGAGGVSAAVAGHHMHHGHHRGIPQHNGGDHDSDNRGGPSDGDGMT
jgi:hypothetical protein